MIFTASVMFTKMYVESDKPKTEEIPKRKIDIGKIAAIVCGGLVGLTLIVTLICYCILYMKGKNQLKIHCKENPFELSDEYEEKKKEIPEDPSDSEYTKQPEALT